MNPLNHAHAHVIDQPVAFGECFVPFIVHGKATNATGTDATIDCVDENGDAVAFPFDVDVIDAWIRTHAASNQNHQIWASGNESTSITPNIAGGSSNQAVVHTARLPRSASGGYVAAGEKLQVYFATGNGYCEAYCLCRRRGG